MLSCEYKSLHYDSFIVITLFATYSWYIIHFMIIQITNLTQSISICTIANICMLPDDVNKFSRGMITPACIACIDIYFYIYTVSYPSIIVASILLSHLYALRTAHFVFHTACCVTNYLPTIFFTSLWQYVYITICILNRYTLYNCPCMLMLWLLQF